ncbi:MAG: hypothetical protein IPP06_12380 [Saprospiraceae bacterium]|nr:hypothetical protein [Candidatus Vicinibacter affinis]
MKNLNKLSKTLLSSLVVVSLFFTACNDDFLDTTSKTSVDEKNAFSTPGKILAQVNNLYSQLQNSIFMVEDLLYSTNSVQMSLGRMMGMQQRVLQFGIRTWLLPMNTSTMYGRPATVQSIQQMF